MRIEILDYEAKSSGGSGSCSLISATAAGLYIRDPHTHRGHQFRRAVSTGWNEKTSHCITHTQSQGFKIFTNRNLLGVEIFQQKANIFSFRNSFSKNMSHPSPKNWKKRNNNGYSVAMQQISQIREFIGFAVGASSVAEGSDMG